MLVITLILVLGGLAYCFLWRRYFSPVCCERCWDLGGLYLPLPLRARDFWWRWKKRAVYSVKILPGLTFGGCAWEDSRTQYAPTDKNPNPNRPIYLCFECAEWHHDYWDGMWQDVYSGSGVWSGMVKTEVPPRRPGLLAALLRWRGLDEDLPPPKEIPPVDPQFQTDDTTPF